MPRRLFVLLLLGLICTLVAQPLVLGQEPAPAAARIALTHAPADPPFSLPVTATGGAPLTSAAEGWPTLFSEDFEGEFPATSWVLSGDPTWGKTTYRALSGSSSAYCAGGGSQAVTPPGPYPNDVEAAMSVGYFDLTNATDAEVIFSHWTNSEYDYDMLWFLASTNGQDWDGFGWTGDWSAQDSCGGWCRETVSLTDVGALGNLVGQPEVWIAFLFTSDSSEQFEGSYLDDISVRAYIAGPQTRRTYLPLIARTFRR